MNKKQKSKFYDLLAAGGAKQSGIEKIMAMLDTALIPEPRKPRVQKPSSSMTLLQWETKRNRLLCLRDVVDWTINNEYPFPIIQQLIEEFRIDMISKGKEYADFRAAFQNYFNKGYLSVKLGDPRLMQAHAGTTIDNRSVKL